MRLLWISHLIDLAAIAGGLAFTVAYWFEAWGHVPLTLQVVVLTMLGLSALKLLAVPRRQEVREQQ